MSRTPLDRLLLPVKNRYGTTRGWLRRWSVMADLAAGRLSEFTGVRLEPVRRLVFACHGNICRSCFAEAQARALGLEAASFGLAAEGRAPAWPLAIETAARLGIDLTAHRATDLGEFRFQAGDLVLAMEVEQALRLGPLARREPVQVSLLGLWARPRSPHIHDPYGLSEAYFERCFRTIAKSVERLARQLESSRRAAALPPE